MCFDCAIALTVLRLAREANNNPVPGAVLRHFLAFAGWHQRNRLAFDLDWPSCIPNAVERTEVVLFVPCVSPYFRTRYGSCEGVVNETQPGEARAWPGRVVGRELLKWRGYGLIS